MSIMQSAGADFITVLGRGNTAAQSFVFFKKRDAVSFRGESQCDCEACYAATDYNSLHPYSLMR